MNKFEVMNYINVFASKCDEKGYIQESDRLQEILTKIAKVSNKEIDLTDIVSARNEVTNHALDKFKKHMV
jgi:hypothetical protein